MVWGFPSGLAVQNLPTVQETWVQSLGWEAPLEEEMATKCSCLENPMDRQEWQATVSRVHGVAKRVRHDLATK